MRTKLLPLTVIGATLAGLALAATAGAGGGKAYGIEDCGKPKVKPDRIVLFCADAGAYINGFDWNDWGGKKSHGTGTIHVNDCDPICLGGTYHDYPVEVTLKKLKRTSCGGKRVPLYRKIDIDFPQGKPGSVGNLPGRLYCY